MHGSVSFLVRFKVARTRTCCNDLNMRQCSRQPNLFAQKTFDSEINQMHLPHLESQPFLPATLVWQQLPWNRIPKKTAFHTSLARFCSFSTHLICFALCHAWPWWHSNFCYLGHGVPKRGRSWWVMMSKWSPIWRLVWYPRSTSMGRRPVHQKWTSLFKRARMKHRYHGANSHIQ